MMRDDFCVFILTHGRPDSVFTYYTITKKGYTGKVYFVVDDEDSTLDQYIKKYGDRVLVFSKDEIAKAFDQGDNLNNRKVIIYARNACFELAKKVGCKYFIQFDDDYTSFGYRFNSKNEYGWWPVRNMDEILTLMLNYYISIPALTVAMAQGGDYIGGGNSDLAAGIKTKRKAMNSFICSTDRPFTFFGSINEDVNTYTNHGRRGGLFLTLCGISLGQRQTQTNQGGMTDVYLEQGTYIKSFYSVMYSPSCVKISVMSSTYKRIHHQVDWEATAPLILREEYRRAG